MNVSVRLKLLWIILAGINLNKLDAHSVHWVTVNTVNARPIAMGGAFQAVEDRWAGIHWNPASFDYTPAEDQFRLTMRFNPLGPAVLINDSRGVDNGLSPIALCLPGLIFNFNPVSIGILTGEESLSNLSRLDKDSWIDGNQYEYSRYMDLAVRLRFASRVSMGVAVQAVYQNPDIGKIAWGYRYGILMKPKPYFHVGLCYYNFNNRVSNTQINLERIPDETLNIGFLFKPRSELSLSVDVRNVSDDHREATLEPHFGIEIIPCQQFSLRGGYFRNRNNCYSTYCTGIGFQCGLLDLGRQFLYNIQWGVDMSYIWEDQFSGIQEWGFFGIFITF